MDKEIMSMKPKIYAASEADPKGFVRTEDFEYVRTRLSAVSGALRRIMKSTPHSMCADAEAWALGEAALASIGEGVSHG